MKTLQPYMYDYVKKNVNLAEYLTTEAGCTLNWYEPNISAGTICPLPDHKDTKPSFRIKFMEDSGVWIWHCLGCNSKGTIIDFCMEYYGLNSSFEAVNFLCKKFNFKGGDQMSLDSLKDIRKKIDLQKKMNCTHVLVAHQCLALLRKDYNKNSKWVKEAYMRMNKSLDEDDIETIESIGYEASKKIGE